MIFQHSQCFQCFQCSKKRGTPLKIPPHCERSSHQTQRRGTHKFHKGETARQGRQHSAGERTSSTREKQHGRGDSTAQGERTNSTREKQHGRCDSTAQGERTSSAGRQDTARATAQESRNEGGRLSEVATLAVVVLETYNHVIIERCKVCVDLLQLLAHFTGFKPCAYDRYND
ncbi:hypothetical protein [Ruminococcus sp.]|uniref:hypothetical protein n=1 Tax=Ruminococcus TaxID=1263 RepID=UPI002E75A05F|nr:hypothetical protein [Ruminococcus sp.]MEE0502583.1 hypothetical protein [Ruminococcus sp.]